MRETKYRAQYKHNKSWHYFEVPGDFFSSPVFADDWENWGKYTNLKDKAGLEIYEGDIIARYWSDGTVLQQFEVKWLNDKAGYNINPALLESTRYNQQTNQTAHGFQVIGNKYDNPERLK